jgi:hypothetical protein
VDDGVAGELREDMRTRIRTALDLDRNGDRVGAVSMLRELAAHAREDNYA